MRCPRCQQENPPQARFCLGCGGRLTLTCANCGTDLPGGARFCLQCGQPVDARSPAESRFPSPEAYTPKHLAEKILTSRSALEGERKQVTVLFADLKSSMELLADRDPEEARRLLDPILEHMMEAVHRYEGTVNQVMGDGIMALFGAPLAHEDHAVRACFAALRLQGSVKRYAEGVRRQEGVFLQVRVGLNSGEVVVRSIGSDLHMDYTAVGQTTHLAARMEQLAAPGSILVAADTLRLVEGYVQVKALGPTTLKGLAAPVDTYELTGTGIVRSRLQAMATRGLSRFVGRETEVEQLRRVLEQARQGHGQVAGIVGEPGVGKTRVVFEFVHSPRVEGWLVLEASSVSYGKATSYLPVIELLKGYFRIGDRDTQRDIREKVTGKLLTLDRTLEPILPALLALLAVPVEDAAWQALDPPQRRQRTLDGVKRLLLREAQLQPLLVVFEDLHWIDSESQAVLDGLVESLPAARVLLLVNYRPEYRHAWGGRTYYTQLRLDTLPAESASELLDALLGPDASLHPLKVLLATETGGNPLFLEEGVRTLVETRTLLGERGAYRLAQPIEAVHVPATVEAILSSRIDRLPPEEKRLLQTAAVIGKDFPFALLQAITGESEEALRHVLSHLQAAEFLYETSLYPDLEYTFKHALTHEVAYRSLLHERRRALHAAIVDALEGPQVGRFADQVERLADHAERGEVWEKAARYLYQAGSKAAKSSAYGDAIARFQHALAALGHLPESEEFLHLAIEIHVAQGSVLIATKGGTTKDVEDCYRQARMLCEKVGETHALFLALWGLWYVNHMRGCLDVARDLGERLLTVARQNRDPSQILQAHHALWPILLEFGELAQAEDHLAEGLALYEPSRHRADAFRYGSHDPGMCCHLYAGRLLFIRGFPDQGRARALEAVRLAREIAHPFTTVMALNGAALIHYWRGERQAALERAEAVLDLMQAHGMIGPQFTIAAKVLRCLIGGSTDQASLAEIGAAFAAWAGTHEHFRVRSLLAEAFGQMGQPAAGLRLVDEALARGEVTFERVWLPVLYRVRGDLLLTLEPASGEAERSFQQAVLLARDLGARSFELRAALSLARLRARQNHPTEAREELAGIYAQFTEGFETSDLRAARALMQEVA